MTDGTRIPLRTRCAYCGNYTAAAYRKPPRQPRTCKPHDDLPKLDAMLNRKPERMQ